LAVGRRGGAVEEVELEELGLETGCFGAGGKGSRLFAG